MWDKKEVKLTFDEKQNLMQLYANIDKEKKDKFYPFLYINKIYYSIIKIAKKENVKNAEDFKDKKIIDAVFDDILYITIHKMKDLTVEEKEERLNLLNENIVSPYTYNYIESKENEVKLILYVKKMITKHIMMLKDSYLGTKDDKNYLDIENLEKDLPITELFKIINVLFINNQDIDKIILNICKEKLLDRSSYECFDIPHNKIYLLSINDSIENVIETKKLFNIIELKKISDQMTVNGQHITFREDIENRFDRQVEDVSITNRENLNAFCYIRNNMSIYFSKEDAINASKEKSEKLRKVLNELNFDNVDF